MNQAKRAHAPPWDELARIQDSVAEREPKDPSARRAMDDAYSAIVDEVEGHTPDSLRRRFSNLMLNRRQKHRDRRAIDEFLARGWTEADDGADPGEILVRRDAAATVLGAVSLGDGALLRAFALGRSYAELGAARNEPPGTVKSRVSRLRGRLRDSLSELAPAAA